MIELISLFVGFLSITGGGASLAQELDSSDRKPTFLDDQEAGRVKSRPAK
jgi:hypothetical protein